MRTFLLYWFLGSLAFGALWALVGAMWKEERVPETVEELERRWQTDEVAR